MNFRIRVLSDPSPMDVDQEDDNIESNVSSSGIFSVLPSLVLRNILSYLPWKDRLTAADAIPVLEEELRSSYLWTWFRLDTGIYQDFRAEYDPQRIYYTMTEIYDPRRMAALTREAESARMCIRKYGSFFQNCIIQLHLTVDFEYALMEDIAANCVNMKTFRITHDGCQMFTSPEQLTRYINCLNGIMTACVELRYIALCNIAFRFPFSYRTDQRYGVKDLLRSLDQNAAENKIQELEFKLEHHELSKHSSSSTMEQLVVPLTSFNNLMKLQCEVESVSTEVVISLKQLRELSIIIDGLGESARLNWPTVQEANPKLEVHYVFVSFDEVLMIPNPLAHTLVVSGQCDYVSLITELINAIVDCYGGSLRQFVQLYPSTQKDWQTETEFYAALANRCQHLNTFLSSCPITAAAIVLIAANRRVTNLWVKKENIQFVRLSLDLAKENGLSAEIVGELEQGDSLDSTMTSLDPLQQQVTQFLGFPWRPLEHQEMSAKIPLSWL